MQKNAKVIDADASCFCFWIFWPPLMVLLLLCSVFGAVVPTWPSNGSKMHGPHTALHHEDQKHHLLTRPMYQSASAANPSKFGWHGTKVPWYSIETFVFCLRGCYCENLPQHVPVPWLNPPFNLIYSILSVSLIITLVIFDDLWWSLFQAANTMCTKWIFRIIGDLFEYKMHHCVPLWQEDLPEQKQEQRRTTNSIQHTQDKTHEPTGCTSTKWMASLHQVAQTYPNHFVEGSERKYLPHSTTIITCRITMRLRFTPLLGVTMWLAYPNNFNRIKAKKIKNIISCTLVFKNLNPEQSWTSMNNHEQSILYWVENMGYIPDHFVIYTRASAKIQQPKHVNYCQSTSGSYQAYECIRMHKNA